MILNPREKLYILCKKLGNYREKYVEWKNDIRHELTEPVDRRCSAEKALPEISQNPRENTRARVCLSTES